MFEGGNIARQRDRIPRSEQRHKVLIRTRMRAGGLPIEVCVCDVSAQGICAMTAAPPARGTRVELTDLAWPVVGQVVWSSHRRFGIAIGDRIDLKRLLIAQAGAATATASRQPRAPSRKRERESRDSGRAMQFAFMVIAGAAGALLIGDLVYGQLSEVVDALGAGGRRP